jgi:hypothetical protein
MYLYVLPPVSTTPVVHPKGTVSRAFLLLVFLLNHILPPVSTTPTAKKTTGINATDCKKTTGINDTGGKFETVYSTTAYSFKMNVK